MIKYLVSAGFGTYRLKIETLNKLSQILKTKQLQVNSAIEYYSNVRLMDEHNKLIGIYSCDEAKKKAEKMGKDIVMVNSEAKPAVCRICDYSDELAIRFLTEIMNKSTQVQRDDRPFKIGHKITASDLKLKVTQAQQQLRKTSQLRVQILCPIEYALDSKNILYNFRDQAMGFMVPIGDIKIKDQEKKASKDDEEANVELVLLEYTFETLDKNLSQKLPPQSTLEKYINQYLIRAKSLERQKQALEEMSEDEDESVQVEQVPDQPLEQVSSEGEELTNAFITRQIKQISILNAAMKLRKI